MRFLHFSLTHCGRSYSIAIKLKLNPAKKITTIPATISRFTAAPINEQRKRRTAGYARVSTDSEEQVTSYEAQVDYYTNYIKKP